MEGVNDSTDASRRWTNILNLSSGYLRGIKIIIKPIIAHTTKRSLVIHLTCLFIIIIR